MFHPLTLTQDDFTPEQWDALCYARKYKVQGDWWRLLRALTSYRSPSSRIPKHMERLVDAWLAAHPSWTGVHYRAERVLYERNRREVRSLDRHYPGGDTLTGDKHG